MDKNQLKKIADQAVSKLDANDYDDFMREIPDALAAAMKRKEEVKKQPNSAWRHYWNWREYVNTDCDGLIIGTLLIWMIGAEGCGIAIALHMQHPELTFMMDRAILIAVVWTLVFLVLPLTLHLKNWKKWYREHPIGLHLLWRVSDYWH